MKYHECLHKSGVTQETNTQKPLAASDIDGHAPVGIEVEQALVGKM